MMDVWPRCLQRLEAEYPAEDVHTWLKPLQARADANSTVLYAPNAFVRDEVQARYMPRIRELLEHFAGTADVSLQVGSLPRTAAPASPVTAADRSAAGPTSSSPCRPAGSRSSSN